jgi:predicted RNA-binding Zn ribbon-like protein
MTDLGQPEEFELSGGALCLDFANTLGDRPRSTSERLNTYGDFLRFSRQTQSIPTGDLEELERLYQDCPTCADAAFERIANVREAIYEIFSSEVLGVSPKEADIETLNAALKKAMRQTELRCCDGDFGWHWGGPAQALDRPLWPIVQSAADLLTSDEVPHLRECDSATCSWLFVDRSRTRRRRWCDMSTCGNRAKARRHYQKQRKTRTEES